jgi:hypothetical protein
MTSSFTRRDFLKLTGAGLLSLLLTDLTADLNPAAAAASVSQGRVAYSKLTSYDAPVFTAKKINSYKRDSLLDIFAEVTGGVPGDYNRRWLQVGAGEYVYSGGVQPVQTIMNKAVTNLPTGGMVGEVTVPYAESWWAINRNPFPGPRAYCATTHWIEELVIDKRDGGLWYKAYDHLFNAYYYIQPEYVRILPPSELTPLAPDVPEHEKYIEVRLDSQVLLAFEGERLAFSCRVATGKGEFNTPEGWFTTFHKRPTAHMVGGESDAAMYDLSGVPWDTYVTESGVALHGTFWHNDFGAPRSHGCVNLTPQDAKRIYRWTLPTVPAGERFLYRPGDGTSVHIVTTASTISRRER